MTVSRLRVAAVIAFAVAGSTATLASGSVHVIAPSVQLAVNGLSGTARTGKNHTCQAGDYRKTTTHSVIIGNERKTIAVVACEQPPRSQFALPSTTLKSVVTGALTEDG